MASLLVKSPNSLWERHFGRSLGRKLRQFSGGRSLICLKCLVGVGWDVWLGEISHCFSTVSWWKGNLNSLKHRKPVALKIFEGRIFCPFFQTGGVRKPHIIALDEPTNYIDMETLDALVQGLARYKGGIIVARWEETAGFGRITSKVWVCLCMIVVLFIVYYGNYIVDYIWYIRYICIRIEK